MSTTYKSFRERLKEERVRLSLSQLEIGQLLRMSQSHYSKVELGTRRLSYYETQCLCETKADVYYIFTGKKCNVEMERFLLGCTFEELVCYLEILCVLLASLNNRNMIMLTNSMHKRIENIQYTLMPCKKGKTIFYKYEKGFEL